MTSFRWCVDSIFKFPSSVKAICNGASVDLKFFTPRAQALSSFAKYKKPVASAVSLLLDLSRPAAVLRRIIFVIVASVDGEPRRTWSHVAKKLGVVIDPLRANANSALPIIGIIFVVGILTARSHAAPNSIFAWDVPAFGKAMSGELLARSFARNTTTATSARAQTVPDDVFSIPAVAKALPKRLSVLMIGEPADNSQFPKTLSNKILDNPRHGTPPQVFLGRYTRRLPEDRERRVIIPYAA